MSHDCAIVIDLWKHWGQNTTVDRNNRTGCCLLVGSKQPIPAVICTPDGKVTDINWQDKGLNGSIPESITNLKNLESL
jgi:hypothetical protein